MVGQVANAVAGKMVTAMAAEIATIDFIQASCLQFMQLRWARLETKLQAEPHRHLLGAGSRLALLLHVGPSRLRMARLMEETHTRESSRSKRTADVEKKRILVIDDDLPLRGMLAAALRRHGFQVLLAGHGAEGQRAL